jgi:hypothetical protein
VEIYIDTEEKGFNKRAFGLLHEQSKEIEEEIGAKLDWDRLPERRASRISLTRPGIVTGPAEELEALKQWGIEKMIAFVDAFQPRIKDLPSP